MEASERQVLAREASNLGVTLSEGQLARLGTYADILRFWNRRVRLLGDRDPEILVRKHIPDCLALLSVLPDEGPVADIGTGAGLPGLVLACARPDLEFWLVESRGRRVSFLQDATARIGLDKVQVMGSRAEELSGDSRLVGRARMVTGRALAVEELIACGLPLLGPRGRLALMQSQKVPVESLPPAEGRAGLRVVDVREYRLGTGEARRIVVLERA